MKIPKSIRIGGVDYEVIESEYLDDGEKALAGGISYGRSVITLRTQDVEHQSKCCALWHEIGHAIVHHAGLDIEESKEEQIVDVFAKGIYQVLQDNDRRLFDIVSEGDKIKADSIVSDTGIFHIPYIWPPYEGNAPKEPQDKDEICDKCWVHREKEVLHPLMIPCQFCEASGVHVFFTPAADEVK